MWLAGGSARKDGELKHGYYVQPTIVAGLPKKHRLFKEEMFVPILCVADYEKFDDAIRLADVGLEPQDVEDARNGDAARLWAKIDAHNAGH